MHGWEGTSKADVTYLWPLFEKNWKEWYAPHSKYFINQAHADCRPAHTWFLKINPV